MCVYIGRKVVGIEALVKKYVCYVRAVVLSNMCVYLEREKEISKAMDGYRERERDKKTEPLWVG